MIAISDNRGFGLIAVVMIILGVALSTTAFIVSSAWEMDAERTLKTQKILTALALAISSANVAQSPTYQRGYEQDVGALPTALADLVTKPAPVAACAYNTAGVRLTGWCGPYWNATYTTETNFLDAWGKTILFNAGTRRIWSIGPNGVNNAGAGDDIVQTF